MGSQPVCLPLLKRPMIEVNGHRITTNGQNYDKDKYPTFAAEPRQRSTFARHQLTYDRNREQKSSDKYNPVFEKRNQSPVSQATE